MIVSCRNIVLSPSRKRFHLDSHYGACFRGCLAHLIRFVEARGDVDRINVVFEGGHKNVEDCRRIFNDLKTRFEYVGINVLGTFSVETKESCPPLMVADMLAHTKAMLNARSAEGTVPTGALVPAQDSKGALAFLEFAPNSLQELKSNFEILRQRQVDAWRARKLSRKEA